MASFFSKLFRNGSHHGARVENNILVNRLPGVFQHVREIARQFLLFEELLGIEIIVSGASGI